MPSPSAGGGAHRALHAGGARLVRHARPHHATPRQPKRAERDAKKQHRIRLRHGATAACGALESAQHTLGFDRVIERAVEELPQKLRLALLLAAMEGHTVEEVAAILGLPVGTVKSRLFAARKHLAEKLRCYVKNTK